MRCYRTEQSDGLRFVTGAEVGSYTAVFTYVLILLSFICVVLHSWGADFILIGIIIVVNFFQRRTLKLPFSVSL